MPNWRRGFVPGGTFFFTVVTEGRARFLCGVPARPILGSLLRRCQLRRPMRINAIVLLPDHFHTIWSLPSGDAAYPTRLGWTKKEFTTNWLALGGAEQPLTAGRINDSLRGVWQLKDGEHTIESPHDFERDFDDIHFNAVKHGLVRCPHEWPWSSFHRWVDAGVYPWHWACWSAAAQRPDFSDIEDTVGEPK